MRRIARRLLLCSAWIARRRQEPTFPTAFTWFDTQRYRQDPVPEQRERIAAREAGPL